MSCMIEQPRMTIRTKIALALWAFIALGIVLTPRILRNLMPRKHIYISIENQKKIAKYEKEVHKSRWTQKNKYHKPPSKFNPNEYQLKDWMSLGLSEKQAKVVLKFCRFPLQSNEDLKRIFVIPGQLFELIKDSTFYPTQPNLSFHLKKEPQEKTQNLLMISKLDSANLIKIKGIGPFYVKMILKYERSLGGFNKKEQLLEVYKMTPEVYEILCDKIDFSEPNIRKISVNLAAEEELNAHPYINRWQANSIVKMRKQLGGYMHLNELLKSHLITKEDFEKLEPYVSL